MNERELYNAVLNFEKGCGTLKWEFGYWYQTIERWYKEGLPEKTGVKGEPGPAEGIGAEAAPWPAGGTQRDQDVHDYFGFHKGLFRLPMRSWFYPLFEARILEEDEENVITVDRMGVKMKTQKGISSTPGYMDWPVHNMEEWEQLKAERLQPNIEERLPRDWEKFKEDVKDRDYPMVMGGMPSGFYGSLRYLMGEVNLLMAYYDKPELVHAISSHLADFWIEIWSQALKEVEVDAIYFWEDMCSTKACNISPDGFREFIMPYYKKVTSAMRELGVKNFLLDTDGNCWEIIPLLMESGITGLYPMEAAAGMDVVEVRKQFPDLVMLGGIDKHKIAQGKESIDQELNYKIPFMLEQGGYIPLIDHFTYPEISWENFEYYRTRMHQMIDAA